MSGENNRKQAADTKQAEQRAKAESDLSEPVKRWLEGKGYIVRGEVRGCDIVGIRAEQPWPVIVELKKRFNLSLMLQAVDRLATSPYVYVAAERADGRNAFPLSDLRRMCALLGIGLLTVKLYRRKPAFVEVHCEPDPARSGLGASGRLVGSGASVGLSVSGGSPKQPGRRTAKLLAEALERSGDYNAGGVSGRKLVTAYRERALRCAAALHKHGPLAPRHVRDMIASDRAAAMLRDNVYGWFRRVERGVYMVTPAGVAALEQFAAVLDAWEPRAAAETAPEAASE